MLIYCSKRVIIQIISFFINLVFKIYRYISFYHTQTDIFKRK